MQQRRRVFSITLLFVFLTGAAFAQEPTKQKKQTFAPSAGSNPVVGSGTTGQIPKWLGSDGSSTFTIGNSNIFEDKFGKVGIGGAPSGTSLLTVRGMIETTLGGYKFPDGTIQTTAFNSNQVVRSLNGLTGNVILAAGANITITPSGNTLTIAAANALTGVAHDGTLQGNGTLTSPLGVAVPLLLSGSGANGNATITATNTSDIGAVGIRGVGGSGMEVFFALPIGVIGESNTGVGVFGNSNDFNGVIGRSDSMDIMNAGVEGSCDKCTGVRGDGLFGVSGKGGSRVGSSVGVGVVGKGGHSPTGTAGIGIFAEGGDSNNGEGGQGMFVRGGEGSGAGNKSGTGIVVVSGFALNGATAGPAGSFSGDVQITGNLSATGTKMFKIDHPLDPENKYLNHAAIESSEVLNIYSGNITTDQNGDATIVLPDWFEALNKDFRYQLTVIGTFAQAIVASKMKDHRFAIKTNAPNTEVSWQVTGVRSDAGMKKYPFQAEEAKAEGERGHYLTPEVFNQPEEKSIEWTRHPEMMQKLKQQRLEAQEKIKKQKQQ
jgi:hypothetical protein